MKTPIQQPEIIVLKGNDSKKYNKHYAKIMRGVVMNTERFSKDSPAWEIRDAVNLARIHAVYATRTGIECFTHESAMLIHGIPTWDNTPEIRAVKGNDRHIVDLKEVEICKHTVVSRKFLPSALMLSKKHVQNINGLPVESLVLTSLRIALSRPAIDAIVAVSEILHEVTLFSRFHQKDSRIAEKKVKDTLLTSLKNVRRKYPRLFNYKRAELIINTADAGCENIAEAALLPFVCATFPNQYVTQYKIHARGNDYYADFAIPGLNLLIEFDGKGKMGSNENEFLDARQESIKRQQLLEMLGYSFIRVTWKELLSPRELMHHLLSVAVTQRENFREESSALRTLLESESVL